MRHHAIVCVLGLVAAACAASEADFDDSWADGGGKADEPSTAGVTPTHAANARLLDGFNKLLDSVQDACLVPGDGVPAYTIGAVEKPFDLYFVSSREDLAKSLGIDVGLQIKYGSTTVGPSVAFLETFRQTRSAVHLVVAARASYRVTNLRSVRLSEQALGWLESDPKTFLHRCGNLYVNGVEHEAQLFVMIRLDALTEEALRSINADLGIGAATAAIGLDATVKAKLEQIAMRDDVSVETHLLDRGFLVDGGTSALITALLETGVSGETFSKIEAVRAAMLASLDADMCRDGGQGVACSERGPGYFENTTRNAVPVQVDLRPYSRAINAPVGGPGSPYEQMRTVLDRANTYLRGLSRVGSRVETVHAELQGFLAEPAARKASYGIAPPAPPVFTVGGLVAIAQQQVSRFDPDGAIARPITAAIASCWSAAGEGGFEACMTPDESGVESMPEVQAAEAALADHAATGKIVPLRFASKGVLGYDAASEACAMATMRLPTFEEARRLAIPIGYAAVPRTDEDRLEFAAWHADRSKCGNDAPAFSNPPGGVAEGICTQEGWWTPHPTTTFCVPPGGPFP